MLRRSPWAHPRIPVIGSQDVGHPAWVVAP